MFMFIVLGGVVLAMLSMIGVGNWLDTGNILGRSYTGRYFAKKGTKQITTKSIADQLSTPAYAIYQVYSNLPVDSKQGWDIVPLLKALDVKFPAADAHFYVYPGTARHFSCACEDKRRGFVKINAMCTYKEYRILKDEISATLQAARDQEHALEVAGVQGDLDRLEFFRATMASERKILSESTTQIKAMQ